MELFHRIHKVGDFAELVQDVYRPFIYTNGIFFSPDCSGNPTLLGVDCNEKRDLHLSKMPKLLLQNIEI
jgi:hypothetical protein